MHGNIATTKTDGKIFATTKRQQFRRLLFSTKTRRYKAKSLLLNHVYTKGLKFQLKSNLFFKIGNINPFRPDPSIFASTKRQKFRLLLFSTQNMTVHDKVCEI